MKSIQQILGLSCFLFLLSCESPVKSTTSISDESLAFKSYKYEETEHYRISLNCGHLYTDSLLKLRSNVQSLFEDSRGTIWIGTSNNGVISYKDSTYMYFHSDMGLIHNDVRNIYEDKDGKIWFGTGKGICKFDNPRFHYYTDDEYWYVDSVSINKWAKADDDLWFGAGQKNGVSRYDGEKIQYLRFSDALNPDEIGENGNGFQVYTILNDSKNNIWMGTRSEGVLRYDGKSFLHIPFNDIGSDVRSIYEDREGRIWIGTNGEGIYVYSDSKLNHISLDLGWSHELFTSNGEMQSTKESLGRVWSIAQDSEGRMWFGSGDSGIWMYNGNEMKVYTDEDGLRSNAVFSIMEDSKGILWVGTTDGGVHHFNGASFEQISEFVDDGC